MRRFLKILPIILPIFLFTSCSVIENYALKAGYQKKEIAEMAVEKIKQEKAAELEKKTKEIEQAKDGLIAQVKKNFQETTNWAYGALLASELKDNKNRLDTILDYRLKTALSFSPGPTPEAIIQQMKTLREELDETRVSNEELKRRYDEKEKEAIAAREAEKQKEDALQKAKDEKIALETEYNKKIDAANNELIERQNRIISMEKSRADDAKARHAAMMKLSIGAGIVALLCIAGAIYSPVFKAQLAMLGAIAGISSVGIWYLQGWHILLFGSVCIAIIIIYVLIKHRKEEKVSDALVLGLQDIKNASGEKWKTEIAPVIKERLKKYIKKDGQIVTEDDKSLEQHIDEKLASWDAK